MPVIAWGLLRHHLCVNRSFELQMCVSDARYDWQKFLTHPFADFFSLPWEEFVLEHNRHHASTVDLLIQGEFGWDPEEGTGTVGHRHRPCLRNREVGRRVGRRVGIESVFRIWGIFSDGSESMDRM